MLFTSLEFLFLFLPVVVAGHLLLPSRLGLRNVWLLAASLAFYAWGEPTFVLAMLASIVFNYVAALCEETLRLSGRRRAAACAFTAGIAGNLALLGTWKYANFATAMLREWLPSLKGAIPQTSFLLPIGISFFTFQAISYLADVRRGAASAQRNPLALALYIALFPQLIAGPIVRYSSFHGQIDGRRVTWDGFSEGVLRFLVGFNKKMLLANTMAEVADRAFAAGGLSVGGAWLGAVAYTLQIYYDFGGYSDMAIGLGRMFGFRFPENFDYPYLSRTATEFWRRWHMTLGGWFRDYVYVPLGGSRRGRARQLLNLAVVWSLTGLWHGANWTFILWGVFYGVLIAVEKLSGLPERVARVRGLGLVAHPATLLAVTCGWVLFRADSLTAAGTYLGTMFGCAGAPLSDGFSAFWLREVAVFLAAAVVGCLPVCAYLRGRVASGLFALVQFAFFVVGLSCLVMKSHNPFIYFNF